MAPGCHSQSWDEKLTFLQAVHSGQKISGPLEKCKIFLQQNLRVYPAPTIKAF
jgi:hypothetical protein